MATFQEAFDKASKQGADNLALINNPFQNALISSYQAANLASQAPNPFMAALGGAAVGAQQLQTNRQQQLEMANFEDVAPQMATQFPQLAKLRAKDAYPLVKEMLLEQQRQQGRMDLTVPKTQIETMKEAGRANRSSSEYAQTRLEIQRRRGKVDTGTFSVGIVPTELNYQPYGDKPTSHALKGNQKIEENLSQLESIQQRVNSLYDSVIRLSQEKGIPINVAISSYLKENPEASAIMDSAGALLPMIAKGYSGEVGNLNEFEQQRAKAVLPNITPSWIRGAPDTIEALIAKRKMFNEMVGIGQKIMYSRAFNNAISTVGSGIYGSKQGYIDDLEEQYSDNPEMLELVQKLANKKSGAKPTTTTKPQPKGQPKDAIDKSLDELFGEGN